jgi:hypothetical protein
LLPVSAGINGLGEADLRIDEPLVVGVPTRVNGSIAVNRLGIRDTRQELLRAQRVEAMGLEVLWPTRLGVKRLLLSGPRALIERDKDGGFPVRALLNRPAPAPTVTPLTNRGGEAAPGGPSLSVEIGEILVRGGTLSWRDEAVKPRVALDFSRLEAKVTGAGWPLGQPLGLRAAVHPPGGGQFQVMGRVGVDPLSGDLHVTAQDAELAPYRTYLPTTARIGGRADLDLAVVVPASSELRATVRGNVGLSRVDVRDGERTVIRIERAAATGVDVDWPQRLGVRQLALQRPWILLERDESGAMPLRALPRPRPPLRRRTRRQQAATATAKAVFPSCWTGSSWTTAERASSIERFRPPSPWISRALRCGWTASPPLRARSPRAWTSADASALALCSACAAPSALWTGRSGST